MEIEKLRARLKNVHKKATEYNMTVKEAQALLAEIDELVVKSETAPATVTQEVVPVRKPNLRVYDGGGF